jgi:protein-S-isoprenylcysteine O-methyltransferase Ste14
MLPERQSRPPLESAFVRVVATCGVIAIGVALGAILRSQDVAGWIIGLVVAIVSVILSAVLWSSRRL